MSDPGLVEALAPWCLLAVVAAMVVAQVRMLLGPSRSDRVVALDLVSVLAAGGLAILAIQVNQPSYARVALVIALVSFLATVALAFYVGHGGGTKGGDAS